MTEPAAPSLARSMLRSGGSFASLNMASLAASMVAGLFAAKALGPELLGVWNTATIVLAYLPFLTFGLDHAAARELPLLRGAGRHDEGELLRSLYLSVALPVALLASAVIVAVALAGGWREELRTSLLVVAVLGIFYCYSRWGVILLKSDHRFGPAAIIDGTRSFAMAACIPLILALGLRGVWVAHVAGAVVGALLVRAWVGRFTARRWDPVRLRAMMSFGLPVMMVSIAQMLSTTGDRMLVLAYLGTTTLGYYGVARTFTQVLQASGGIVGPIVYPRMTERLGQTGQVSTLLPLVVVPTQILGALLPVAVAAAWFGLPVMIEWLLPEYGAAIPAARLLSLSMAAYLICGAADYLLVSAQRQLLSLALYAGGVAFALVLEALALGSGYGLTGVAAGAGIGNIVYTVVVLLVAQRLAGQSRTESRRVTRRSVLPLMLVTAMCLLSDAYWPVPGHGLGTAPAALLRWLAVSAVCLPATVWVLDHARPGWRSVRG